MTNIRITDNEATLSFEFDDLVRFHGTKSICGLTVAFKIMEAAWDAIWKDTPPKRDVLAVASGFPGPGTRDGFEMVTRAVSRDAYEILVDLEHGPLVAEAAKGVYFFRLADNCQTIDLGLKPEVVPEEFVPRRRQIARGEATKEDAARFRVLQFEFSDKLRGLSSAQAVNILDIRRK